MAWVKTTQAYRFTYNAQANPTGAIDPLGREAQINYQPNGIDVLNVRQKTGASTWATISSFTYSEWRSRSFHSREERIFPWSGSDEPPKTASARAGAGRDQCWSSFKADRASHGDLEFSAGAAGGFVVGEEEASRPLHCEGDRRSFTGIEPQSFCVHGRSRRRRGSEQPAVLQGGRSELLDLDQT